MNFESTTKVSEEELEGLLKEELSRRQVRDTAGTIGVPAATFGTRGAIHASLLDTLIGEFEEIRNNPELSAKNMDQMVRTYDKYLSQGNDPVEVFVPNDQNVWAAGQMENGDDVVWYDPGAPHAPVMAHELGHVQMNHSNDPLSWLQTSGVGRLSGSLALPLGALGAAAGYQAMPKRRLAGAALGTALGAVGASGNFAYELGGATGRAMDYLPEDVDQEDAYGDLFRAGMTYGMAGPGTAVAAGLSTAGLLDLARRAI
tara:strand:+ start:877 stop:1650 length:774 start_codon:yes stop_codon:yes gene_type:complete